MTDHADHIRATPAEDRGFRRLRRGEWGSWRLDTDQMVIWTDKSGAAYEIPLEECTSSAQVLDWFAQIASKQWGDDETLAGLVRAIDDLLLPQQNLCSWGQSQELTPEEIRELVRAATQ